MKLCEFSDELYGRLQKDLEAIEPESRDASYHEAVIAVLYRYIQELKDAVKKYSFADSAEEISFFKEIKPKFTCLLIYHMAVYNIETGRPTGLQKAIQEYYNLALEKIKYFFTENFELYRYYRSNATHLDIQYFLRGNLDIHLAQGAFLLDMDSSFSTLCDYKIAKILANEMLVAYLNDAVAAADGQSIVRNKVSITEKFHLAWTASKTDFIELLYGLYCIGAFNNGSVELNKVMTVFAVSFGIDFGNYSRYFQQMRIRKKNRTSFIDKIREKLIDYMDELDDQLDNR